LSLKLNKATLNVTNEIDRTNDLVVKLEELFYNKNLNMYNSRGSYEVLSNYKTDIKILIKNCTNLEKVYIIKDNMFTRD